NADKLHPMGGAVLHPQVECDLLHCQFVLLAAKVEEAVMGQQSPPYALEAGDGRIETAGDEREDAILASQRISSQPRNGAFHHEQVIAVNFDAHRDFRIVQLDLRTRLTLQPRTNMTLDIHGVETMHALALATYRKGFTWQQGSVMAAHLIQDAIQVCGQRALAHLHGPRDTGRMRQTVDHALKFRPFLDTGAYFQIVPVAPDGDLGIDQGQLGTQAAAQDADEAVPYRTTFDGDLGEKTHYKEHERFRLSGTILRQNAP